MILQQKDLSAFFFLIITVILFYNLLLCNITGKNLCTDCIPVLAIDTKMAESLQESVSDLHSLSETVAIGRQNGGFRLVFNKYRDEDSLEND